MISWLGPRASWPRTAWGREDDPRPRPISGRTDMRTHLTRGEALGKVSFLIDLPVESRPTDPEMLGGLSHVAAVLLQREPDDIGLDIRQRTNMSVAVEKIDHVVGPKTGSTKSSTRASRHQ
jgi:hypothetical protein